MIDPRLAVIEKRFADIKRILVFLSGKGGVGKSSCASVAALLLAQSGRAAGLLDLDFQGASDHVILGIEPSFPEEEKGLLPIRTPEGLDFMSAVCFTREQPLALRGEWITQAVLELFSVTLWKNLDILCIDMPPGCGDEVLDVLRFIPRSEMVLLTTPGILSSRVNRRLLDLLNRLEVPLAGVIVNMVQNSHFQGEEGRDSVIETGFPTGVPLLGAIPMFPEFEGELGSPKAILGGEFARSVKSLLGTLGLEC